MTLPGIYAFDAADAELSLMPMAVRRALDASGVHLSLRGWQGLELPARQRLVQLGAAERVDVVGVQACLGGCEPHMRAAEALAEPDVALGPGAELAAAVGAESALATRWSGLSALDRYVLSSLARRGKLERLSEALSEILATG